MKRKCEYNSALNKPIFIIMYILAIHSFRVLGYQINIIACESPRGLSSTAKRHSSRNALLFALCLGLFLKVGLHATLLRLAFVMERVVVSLAFLVACESGNGTADSALDAVADARAKVAQLATSLLLLTLEVLLTTGVLK